MEWTAIILAAITAVLIGRSAAAPYYGKEIGSFATHIHDVQGRVYAVDDRTIYIKGFTYDGQGPDAYLWAGSSSRGPDASGFIIPDEKGKKTPLKEYRNKDILVRLPGGKTLQDIRWLSVWCKKFQANFGSLTIPSDLTVPRPAEIGSIRSPKAGVSSGPVTVVDTQTILVTDFTYDGKGKGAHWWVSRGGRQHPRGIRLPDENGSLEPLSAARGRTVVISLPEGHSVHDVDWFGVWGEESGEDMGSVAIPRDLVVPPSLMTLGVELEYKLNCEVLRDDLGFEIRWIMDGEDIVVQLVARLDPSEYMAFGLSKNDSRSQMAKSDAVVGWIDHKGTGYAVDYYLDSKEQCVGERGSCPDSNLPDGRNGVTLLNTATVNGYTMITFKRPQVGMDKRYDQHVYSDGPQAVVWAIGPVDKKNKISYHGIMRSEGNVFVDFARSPQWNCPQPADEAEETRNTEVASPWAVPPIVCPTDRTFRAQVGPAAGEGGLKWYLNGLLHPEITIQRGFNYTFIVEGGNDPLYITDDAEGGFEHKTPAEKKKVKLFAGVTEQGRKKFTPTGRGRLCEWKLPSNSKPLDFESFDAFHGNLELRCDRGRAARLTFRPDSRTPDLIYYQSYRQPHLGGKIHVVDSCEQLLPSASVSRLQAAEAIPPNSLQTPDESDFRRGGEKPKKRFFLTTTTTTPPPPRVVTMETFQLRDVVHPGGQSSLWWRPSQLQKATHQAPSESVTREKAISSLRHQLAALQHPRDAAVAGGTHRRDPVPTTTTRGPHQDPQRRPANTQKGPNYSQGNSNSQRGPSQGSSNSQRGGQPRSPHRGANDRNHQGGRGGQPQMVPVLVRDPLSRSSSRVVPVTVKGSGYTLQQVLSLLGSKDLKLVRLN